MTDIAKITTAVSPLEEVDKINEVIQRANENTSAIALLEGAPTGSVMPYAGSTAPTGWLICDGSAISRTTYADLFAVIGTTYGAGDGSTTFKLPDFTDRVIQGGTAGTYKAAGLPNITGDSSLKIGSYTPSGCFVTSHSSNVYSYGSSMSGNKVVFNASSSNSIYGNSTTVQPPALCVNICIKY